MIREDEKLKACPFCGAEAERNGVELLAHGNSWHIGCWKCGVAQEMPRTKAEAIAAWNRRTERTIRPQTVEKEKTNGF